MTIRANLTLKFTTITASVFLLSLVVISLANEQIRKDTFIHNLRAEAITKAHLFLMGRVDAATMQSTYLNNTEFIDEVEVAVYTPQFEMLYHDAIESDIVKETPSLVDEIAEKGQLDFMVGDYQAVGILFTNAGEEYVVTAAAYDGLGILHQQQLLGMLALLFVAGLFVLWGTCYILASIALRPIRRIVKETEEMTGSRPDQRLSIGPEHDELTLLRKTLNSLLNRIERAFKAQQMFVSHASHELRTPLTSLTAELDLTLQKKRTPQEYERSIAQASDDAKRLSSLVTSLLQLARTDVDASQLPKEPLRIDELLLDVRQQILTYRPDYHIEIILDPDEADDDRCMTVVANPYLLQVAMTNLAENNCKYSDNHTSTIQVTHTEDQVEIRFSDTGIGMSDDVMENLFTVFYRGENARHTEGHGIGMTVAKRVIDTTGGTLQIFSAVGKGTTYVVSLPHIF